MSCCGGGGGPDVRGRRVYYVVLDKTGREDSEWQIFSQAQKRMIEMGDGATMTVRKKFPN